MADHEKPKNVFPVVIASNAAAAEATASVRRFAELARAIHDDAPIVRALAQIKELQIAIQPTANVISEMTRALAESDAVRQMAQMAENYKSLVRVAAGPFEELARCGSELRLAWQSDMELIQSTVAGFESRFRLPEVTESFQLFSKLAVDNSLSSFAKAFIEDTSTLKVAIEAMKEPWVEIGEVTRSMSAFAELQGIGQALRTVPAFDENLVAAMRVDLGDWRDRIVFPDRIFSDLTVRSQFYADLGFNTALTDFPAPAFRQNLEIAGLHRQPPPALDRYKAPVPRATSDDVEQGYVRTNLAHDWLLRLETHLRRFIDELMVGQYGPDWAKHRLPNGVYELWQEKKRKALEAGSKEQPLIAYADFTDYENVICKRDNWREVFAAFFRRPESVRESFQRLYPVRLDTMHARIITQDDELLLRAEVTRLFKAIIS